MQVTVRPATPADAVGIARVHVDSWRTTYRGIVPDHVLDGLSYERRQRTWAAGLQAPDHCIFVAEEGGAIVGFAAGGAERENDPTYTGELYAIYVLQERQGKGIGRGLTRAVAARLLQDGHRALLVWVLAQNPACRFYEALGGRELRSKTLNMGGADLLEVAYGWPDLTVLT